MRRQSQMGLEWRISPPICARIPRGRIPCAETLETPLKLKKVIYSQHVEFCHVEFWLICVPEFHVTEIHVLKLSYASADTVGGTNGGEVPYTFNVLSIYVSRRRKRRCPKCLLYYNACRIIFKY